MGFLSGGDVELRLQVLERINAPRLTTIAQPQHRYRLQVLVVDDHQINRQVLRQQLAFLGHDVIEAADKDLDSMHSFMLLQHGKVVAEGHGRAILDEAAMRNPAT